MRWFLGIVMVLGFAGSVLAKDVYVRPYVKKDGTYVPGHHRSSPNSTRSDNYGRNSGSLRDTVYPAGRDTDRDGLVNIYDLDDDNDGTLDDFE